MAAEHGMRRWSLIEQGLLSLANFGLAIFLARELPKGEWGAFSLGFAMMLFAQGFQRALVSIPVATMAHNAELLSRSLPFWRRLQRWLTLGCAGVLALAAAAWQGLGWDQGMARALLVALLLVPGYFALEFWRRLLIQARDIRVAACVAGMFFLLALLLVVALRITQGGALMAAGGMSLCAVWSAGTLRWRATRIIPCGGEPLDLGAEVLRFGRWATLSHLAFSGYNTAIQVILSLVCGPAAMGSFAAVRNLTQPINTLIGAVDNLDKPRAARAFAAGGFSELFSSLGRTVMTLSLLGGLYLLICAAGGGHLVQAFYHGRYGQAWEEIWMWCLIALAMMAAQPLESGLYVVQRADALFLNRLVSAVVGLGAALATIPLYGVMGALVGLAAGWLTTALLALVQLQLLSRQAVRLEAVQG